MFFLHTDIHIIVTGIRPRCVCVCVCVCVWFQELFSTININCNTLSFEGSCDSENPSNG